MKKIISFVMVLSLMLLVGCQSKPAESPDTSTDAPSSSSNMRFDVTGLVSAKAKNVSKKQDGTASLSAPYKTDEEKLKIENVCVIRGKVTAAQYVLDGSTAFTKSEVIVEESFVGDLKEGSTVSVREMGGFVPADVLSNAIEKEKFGTDSSNTNTSSEIVDVRTDGFKVMEQGEEVILFLVPIEDAPDSFKGCYDLIRMWQGKLLYNEELKAYVPYVPDYELASEIDEAEQNSIKVKSVGQAENGVQARIYTLDEFRTFIDNNK